MQAYLSVSTWVVRKSPVDLGIWTIIHPTELYIPLDAHVAKMAHQTWDNNTQNRGLENGSTSNQLHENNFPG